MTDPSTPSAQEGPNDGPPSLPDGWLAQWEGQSRKYYYVQRATGHSQWDVPTQPALSVPTPDPTPQQHADPFSKPAQNEGLQVERSAPLRDEHGNVVETDRSLLGDLAMNAITGGKHKPQNPSGLGGLASSFLGGGSQSGHSGSGSGSGSGGGSGGGFGGLAGQLVGSLLDGGKPNKPQQQQSSQQSSSSGQSGGLMGFLGGHHGSSNQGNSYGYSSSGHGPSSGGYSGQAPPASYQPPTQHSSNQPASSGVQHQAVQQARPYGVSSVQHQNLIQAPQTSNQYGGSGASYGQSSQPYSGAGNSYAPNYNSSQVSLAGSTTSGAPPYGQQYPTSHESYAQQYQSSSQPTLHHGQHDHIKPPQDPQVSGSNQYSPQQGGYNPQNPSFSGPPSSQSSTPAYGLPNLNQTYPPPPTSAYGQQPPSHSQPPAYGQFPTSQPQTGYGTPSQSEYPPPPQNTPAYGSQQQSQGGYNSYPPALAMSSHPSQQVSGPYQLDAPQAQYPSRPTSSSAYPGQQSHNLHQQNPQRPIGQGGSEHSAHDSYPMGAPISSPAGSGYGQPPPPPAPNTQQPGQQQHRPPGQYDPYRY